MRRLLRLSDGHQLGLSVLDCPDAVHLLFYTAQITDAAGRLHGPVEGYLEVPEGCHVDMHNNVCCVIAARLQEELGVPWTL